jgi:hypothetical protein
MGGVGGFYKDKPAPRNWFFKATYKTPNPMVIYRYRFGK